MKYMIAIVAAASLMMGVALAQTQTAPTYPQQNPQQYPTAPQQQYPQQPYPQTSQPGVWNTQGAFTLPAGTELSIRTNENIDATKQDVGHTYSAEISQDLMGPNGQVLIPRGSPAQLSVVSSKGTLGTSELALGLQSVTVNGRQMSVVSNTQNANDRGIGKNKRTAEMTGGGAVLGTVIGAIAGGAKGAVIGAVAGAGAGAGAQVLTKGNQVKVPAETVLNFKLDQPLTLQ